MAKILDLTGKEKQEVALPSQFGEEYRPDLIKRAVLALRSHKIQKTYPKRDAGNVHSADLSKRRREYRGTYGIGQSRTPRKVMTRKGSRFHMMGANVAHTVGGRKAHGPVAEKIDAEKINKKERRKAIRSAIAATTIKEIVAKRGHKVDKVSEFPLIIIDDVEKVSKAKEVSELLSKLNLAKELKRAEKKKVRAGKGKNRGRKYKKKKGPLFVVSGNCELLKAAKNLAGIDVVEVKDLNAELLAPGTYPGRLVVWSEASIKKMGEKKLFE